MKYIRFFLLFVSFSAAFLSAQTVNKKNVNSKLSSKNDKDKIAALDFVIANQYKKANSKLNNMLDSEKDKPEVFRKVLLANGTVQNKSATKKIHKIYQESDKSSVRFTCVLALLDLQDISSLKFVKEAYKTETDVHTKAVLQKVVDKLEKK